MPLIWKTADGRMIPVSDIEDDHLNNIIKDGYRHPELIAEARRRGLSVPDRKVDQLSDKELAVWVESFASCAISGNFFAQLMIDSFNENKNLFLFHLNHYLERLDDEDRRMKHVLKN